MPVKKPSPRSQSAATSKGSPRAVAGAVHQLVQQATEVVFQPAGLIDPLQVQFGRTPNRADAAFDRHDAEYAEIEASIRSQGGNRVPILVRRLAAKERVEGYRFELIAGERRLRVCRGLGLKVLATAVENIDAPAQVLLTMTENAGRSSLRPYELGRQVLHAMKVTGRSQNEIAAALGHDKGQISKAIAITRLPVELLRAFTSEREIRYGDLGKLQDALRRDRNATLTEARKIRREGGELTTKEVVCRLTAAVQCVQGGPEGKEPQTFAVPPVMIDGRMVAKARLDEAGRLQISMQVPLSEKDQAKLLDRVRAFVEKTVQYRGVAAA